jgi:hypothetical protein
LERRVLPLVEEVLAIRSAQSDALKDELDAALRDLFDRCARQAGVAFADPSGTHASWRRLRDWLADHPGVHGLADDHPVFTTDWRPRRAAPAPSAPVPVVLE